MLQDGSRDHLVVIGIEGMHCHKCEQAIQRSLKRLVGVSEVEVDFPTAQASVLFDASRVAVSDLMHAVTQAGYRVVGFTRNEFDVN
jgi:copper chaperone CopZ